MTIKYWRNFLTMMAGVWLLLSPWLLNYHHLSTATWSALVVGSLLILSEAMAFIRPGAWEGLLDVVLGTYLISSPYVLGFAKDVLVANNVSVIGLLMIALAIVALAEDTNAQRWWHDHMHHSG